jgi:hypothetical protein
VEQLKKVVSEVSFSEFIHIKVISWGYTDIEKVVETVWVLGSAIMRLSDPIGTQMTERTLEEMLQFGKPFPWRIASTVRVLTSVRVSLPDIYWSIDWKECRIDFGVGTINIQTFMILKTFTGIDKESEWVVINIFLKEWQIRDQKHWNWHELKEIDSFWIWLLWDYERYWQMR